MGWIGEMGQKKDPCAYGSARRALSAEEISLKNARNYGGSQFKETQPVAHQHFGVFIVSCEKADLRPLSNGVMIYADNEKRLEALPAPTIPRVEVIDELYAAVVEGRAPLHDGEWAMATLQVCLALLDSARSGKEVLL
jgi:phthalate 4,5-cis-dihydrodiol dehydrogenase